MFTKSCCGQRSLARSTGMAACRGYNMGGPNNDLQVLSDFSHISAYWGVRRGPKRKTISSYYVLWLRNSFKGFHVKFFFLGFEDEWSWAEEMSKVNEMLLRRETPWMIVYLKGASKYSNPFMTQREISSSSYSCKKKAILWFGFHTLGTFRVIFYS